MNDRPYLLHAYLETKRLPIFQQETRLEGGDSNKPRANLLLKQGIIPSCSLCVYRGLGGSTECREDAGEGAREGQVLSSLSQPCSSLSSGVCGLGDVTIISALCLGGKRHLIAL